MLIRTLPQRRGAGGFSLIEVMVAMVAGLILIGAVIALVTSVAQANALAMQSIRLTQELRALMDITTRDVRRAGTVANPIARIGKDTANPYGTITVANSGACIRFQYSNTGDDGRTYEFRNGALFFGSAEAAAPACADATTQVSSPQVTLTAMTFAHDATLRTVTISLTGRLTSDTTISRSLQQVVLVPSLSPP